MKVRSPFERNPFLRNLSVSIAGARTGGALVADQALNKLLPGRKKNKLLESEGKTICCGIRKAQRHLRKNRADDGFDGRACAARRANRGSSPA